MSTSSPEQPGRSRPPDLISLASPAELRATVADMAAAISADHPDGLVAVGVLKGSVPLLADLIRAVTVPVQVDFLAISPYQRGTGRVRLVRDLDLSIADRPVVVVEDIVDTGLTLNFLLDGLRQRDPSSLRVAALADKRVRRLVPVPIDYVGLEVPDVFVLGYGLDFAGRYRNLAELVGGDALRLAAEPDCYVMDLYGEALDR